MKPSSYSTDLFIRPTDRAMFNALSAAVPENSEMVRLGVLGPRHSGRKTLLKELMKRRGALPGRHYLLNGTQAIQEIREACKDPMARTLVLLDVGNPSLIEHLTHLEFKAPQRPCLVAWNQDSSDEECPATDFHLITEIKLFDEEESRDLQRVLAKHFIGSVPEAENFLTEKLESHDLYWFPCAFNAFRKEIDLLVSQNRQIDFLNIFNRVDTVFFGYPLHKYKA